MFPFSPSGKTKMLSFFPHSTWEQESCLLRVPCWDMFAVYFLRLSEVVLHSEGARIGTSEAFHSALRAGSPLTSENIIKSPDDLIGLSYLWNRWCDSHTFDINVPALRWSASLCSVEEWINKQWYGNNVKHDLWLKQKVGVGCFMVKATHYDSRLWISNQRPVTSYVASGGLLEALICTCRPPMPNSLVISPSSEING